MGDGQKLEIKGDILKSARVARGLAVEAVHEATKIPIDVIKAIEEGYSVRTLTPFYLKGFVKMYAQFLGVDVHQVLESYRVESVLPPPVVKKTDSGVELQAFLQKYLTKKNQQQLVKGAAVLLALLFVARIAGCVRDSWKHAPAAKASAKETVSATPKPPVKKRVKKSAVKTLPAGEKTAAVPAPDAVVKKEPPLEPPQKSAVSAAPAPAVDVKSVRLTIKAKNSGWLQVKVDGNLVFQSILNSGATESWEADKSIELSGKNIHSLEYEVNGKMLGELGRADRSARRVVITRDGLTVKQ